MLESLTVFSAGAASIWLFWGLLAAVASNWFTFAERFPNRLSPPLLTLRGRSGRMRSLLGRANFTLNLTVTPIGLRVAMWGLSAPFCRPFLVPWHQISVKRSANVTWDDGVRLTFGDVAGSLEIAAHIADALARAAGDRWPERGAFPPETLRQSVRRTLIPAATGAILGVAILTFVPRLMFGNSKFPLAISIGLPPVAFGIIAWVAFIRRRKT